MADNPGGAQIARLVVDHYSDVYRYAYRLSGSSADAEDLTQQSFLLAQRNLATIDRDALFWRELSGCQPRKRRSQFRVGPCSGSTLRATHW